MSRRIIREVTQLGEEDLVVITTHPRAKVDIPLHYHPEYELRMVQCATGTVTVGDVTHTFSENELVLVAPNVPHSWNSNENDAEMTTIQFSPELIPETILARRVMSPIKALLERAQRGVRFPKETTELVLKKIEELNTLSDFDATLAYLSLLHELGNIEGSEQIALHQVEGQMTNTKNRRIRKVLTHINNNIHSTIMLADVADLVGMSPSAFSHFFKRHTKRSFTDYLIEYRLGIASKLLIETDKTIAEICFKSGFENISNFNRAFKSQKQCTPREYRAKRKIVATSYKVM